LLPAVYASNDRLAAEWFAPAGLNRGGITGAVAVLDRLTHSDRDTLYEGKVNPIAQFPGQGIVAFGQKTLQARPSALDRINVRRLLITVKKYIASTSRYLIFEQNTTDTRTKFLNTVNPYLENIQQRQGLYAFKVVMDETNNTPDVIDRNILKGAIFLQPTKTAEFIQIDFNVLPTGATFNA
jgi:phage tail sheath protein FI